MSSCDCDKCSSLFVNPIKVSIEEIIEIDTRRRQINSYPLDKIIFTKEGKVVNIPEELINDWDFTGLNNIGFITSGKYIEELNPYVLCWAFDQLQPVSRKGAFIHAKHAEESKTLCGKNVYAFWSPIQDFDEELDCDLCREEFNNK